MESKLEIIFLYDDLCPAKDEAWSSLRKALQETGIRAKVRKMNVLEYAQKTLRYYPSPTILINGEDVFRGSVSCDTSCGAG
jgi:ribosomal protein L10